MKYLMRTTAIGLFLLAAALFAISLPARGVFDYKPPFSAPIDLSRGEKTFEWVVSIQDHRVYWYSLRFAFDAKDPAGRKRVLDLMGGPTTDKSGKATNPGVPTPVTLSIFRVDEKIENKIYERTVDPSLSSWSRDSFSKVIGYCDLTPGIYKFKLVNHRSSPEFAEVQSFLAVGHDTFKVTYDLQSPNKSKSCPE